MSVEAFPLQWPSGWPRLSDNLYRDKARFQTQFAKARDELMKELERMGASNVVLSTNIPLRRDGLPYAGQANPQDPGAAVYFLYKKKAMVFACDRWTTVTDNIQALNKTIEAIRGIERWGASTMLERAFTGFQALPEANRKKDWHEVLGVRKNAPWMEVEMARKEKAFTHHPDRGGSNEKMAEINGAYEEASKLYGMQ